MAIHSITLRTLSAKLKEAKSYPNGLYVWDSDLKGFGIRISQNGRATWLAQKAIGRGAGSTQRIVLGHYPALSLEDARIKAGQTISSLASGEDVRSVKASAKAAKIERLKCPTIKQAVSDYLSHRDASPGSDPISRYEIEVRQLFERQIVPELGASTRINDVTKADIRSLIKKRKDAGHNVAARNLFIQLRPFFDWCIQEDHISVSPCADVAAPEPAVKRQHKLIEQETVALWSASHQFKQFGPYWRLLLMLIQRRSELAGMRWREIDIERAEWIIPGSRTKNGRDHLVPLPPQAVAELEALERRKGEADYVFGKYPNAPLSGFSKAKRELDEAMLAKLQEDDEAAILRPWRMHDLRRTGASSMSGLRVLSGHKVQPHIIEAILNHTPSALEATYQVWELYRYSDEKREALNVWANHISALINPLTTSNNVVAFYAQA